MKRLLALLAFVFLVAFAAAQNPSRNSNPNNRPAPTTNKTSTPTHSMQNASQQANTMHKDTIKLGIFISTNDPEKLCNAFKIGCATLQQGGQVRVFLTGAAVECDGIDSTEFHVREQIEKFTQLKGRIFAEGTSLHERHIETPKSFQMANINTSVGILRWADQILSF
ncbi:MAG: DsrE family protein [Bacteroidales bacterium]|nr:DsrE family protein [Bacteroidales bacterium]